jgi:hypothetical protein
MMAACGPARTTIIGDCAGHTDRAAGESSCTAVEFRPVRRLAYAPEHKDLVYTFGGAARSTASRPARIS